MGRSQGSREGAAEAQPRSEINLISYLVSKDWMAKLNTTSQRLRIPWLRSHEVPTRRRRCAEAISVSLALGDIGVTLNLFHKLHTVPPPV